MPHCTVPRAKRGLSSTGTRFAAITQQRIVDEGVEESPAIADQMPTLDGHVTEVPLVLGIVQDGIIVEERGKGGGGWIEQP